VVIADNCAPIVNKIFENYETQPSSLLILGVILFAFQIYGDFSGYSDIAIGTAKLFGFKLMTNFKVPYFSTSWGEFWKRWHISLSSWILDYVYNPIALDKRHWGIYGIVFGLMITFILNGLWHGANYTFVVFGFILGTYISLEFLLKNQRLKFKKRFGKTVHKRMGWLVTMVLWLFACIFFRAESLTHAFSYIGNIFTSEQTFSFAELSKYKVLGLWIIGLFVCDYIYRNRPYEFDLYNIKFKVVRFGIYVTMIALILRYSIFGSEQQFIYFQF